MAGSIINTYTQLDTDILALQLTEDASFVGKHNISLTNYDTTGLPAIAAGSIVECNGALCEFASEEAITGSPSDGTVYIQIVPGATTCTAAFTNTAPTWSDAKQGFYGTGGAANYRYLEFEMTKEGAGYSSKQKITHDDNVLFDNVTSTTAGITTAGITTANVTTANVITDNVTTANVTTANVITEVISGVLSSKTGGGGRITAFTENVSDRWLQNYSGTTSENGIYSFFRNHVGDLLANTYYRLNGTLYKSGDAITKYLILNGFQYISSTGKYIVYGTWANSCYAGYLEIAWGGSNTYIASMVF